MKVSTFRKNEGTPDPMRKKERGKIKISEVKRKKKKVRLKRRIRGVPGITGKH